MSERFVNRQLEGIQLGDSECQDCKHIHLDGVTCDAFPDGIPAPILGGRIKHRKPYPGDHGIQFESRDD